MVQPRKKAQPSELYQLESELILRQSDRKHAVLSIMKSWLELVGTKSAAGMR